MSSNAATYALSGSRPRVLAERSRSGRLARRPSRGNAARSSKEELFRKKVWKYWKKNGRHTLPWRQTADPYKILVSEVMLQQTQVSRVSEKYREFLEVFPNVRTLARASLIDVLKVWSGLGYNRRAKYLHDAAKIIVAKYTGKVPAVYSELVELPGIGDYTARSVRAFAFNEPEVLIETNVRAVFLHRFFPRSLRVDDKKLLPLIAVALEGQEPRTFYAALMDYGSHLKRTYPNPSRRSKHHVKQSKFEGSLRQVRGAILRAMALEESIEEIKKRYPGKFDRAVTSLIREGLISVKAI